METFNNEWIRRDGEFCDVVIKMLNSMSNTNVYSPSTEIDNKRHMDIVCYNSNKNTWSGIDVKKPKRINRNDLFSSENTMTIELLNPFGFNGWSRPDMEEGKINPKTVLQFFASKGIIDRGCVWSLPKLAEDAISAIGYDAKSFIKTLDEYSKSENRGKYGSVDELCYRNGWDVMVDNETRRYSHKIKMYNGYMGILRTRQTMPDGSPECDLFITLPIDKIKPDGEFIVPEKWRRELSETCWARTNKNA